MRTLSPVDEHAIDDVGNVAPISNVVRWDWLIDTAGVLIGVALASRLWR